MNIKSIYRKIAKRHEITIPEAISQMQAAIDYAYQNLNQSENQTEKQKSIPSKGDIPTPDEFIKHVAKEVKRQK